MVKTIKDSRNTKLSQVDGAHAYAELRQAVVAEGILNRSYGYYALVLLFVFTGFFFSFYNLYIHNSYLTLFYWCLFFSFFAVQLGGFMHDTGHRAVFKSSKINDALGYAVCTMLALRFRNWKVKHNMHHAHPNQEEADTDIEIPFFFTEERYRKNSQGLRAFIRKYQAYLFYPIGSLVAFSMRITAFRDYKKNVAKEQPWEIILFFASLFIWFVLPFLLFEPLKAMFIILVVNLAMGFYLMNIFAPNHKGMVEIGKGVKLSFVEQQIITARNINSHWLTDFIYMGLNYQIEHHLFPNCPRNKLKYLTPLVKKLCRTRRLGYTNVSVFESSKIILTELNSVSKLGKKHS